MRPRLGVGWTGEGIGCGDGMQSAGEFARGRLADGGWGGGEVYGRFGGIVLISNGGGW